VNAPPKNFRDLPSVDSILQQSEDLVGLWGRELVTDTLRGLIDSLRQRILQGENPDLSTDAILLAAQQKLAAAQRPTLVPVLNLTGTVLHTNLGRACLPEEAMAAIHAASVGASNLEFDLETGARGDRDVHVEKLICELTGTEAATVVNNNAAAVLLVLNTLAMGREVPVSRGELVEIGGSFRIPEVMQRSGCTLVEIGATNRTHLKDYANAINASTALLLKVHTSNYQIQGFTREVTESELAQLARDHELPLVIDLGSGNLLDFPAWGLPAEQTVSDAIASGADIVTFSGDKLLGGPQAGIIAGRKDLVARIKSNPLKRALRLDKMTLAGLAEILKLYRDPEVAVQKIPTLRALTRRQPDIRAQAERVAQKLIGLVSEEASYCISVEDCSSQIGSGSLPVDTLPSVALRLSPANENSDVQTLSAQLRRATLPVIGRIHKNALWLDIRCLETDAEEHLIQQLSLLSQCS
jgi:L-seryl-tRNA(Ser) seleniumtransferase